ncbi:MAG: phospholipase D-like domain-containing protein [Calditerrivibrio sp.]|nr:phospholipase D-like domain-containing protein [Calditerrivibrio sp.]
MNYTKRLLRFVQNKTAFFIATLLFIIVFWFASYYKEHDIAFLPDETLIRSMVSDVEFSKMSIYIAIYFFKTDNDGYAKELKTALLRAADRGVRVYIVLDVAENDITTDANLVTAKELNHNNIVVKVDSPFRKLHSKIMVIDEEVVYLGSHNYTNSAFSKNNESTLRIKSKKIAKECINYIKGIKAYDID